MKRACERRTTNGGHQTAGAPPPTKNDERRASPPPHCPNFTTTTSTKMLTTTTTSYPISRSRPLLAALTELNPFTVPKSQKTCSFRCINWWHFCVERGEGKNRRRAEEEGRKGRIRPQGAAGQPRARWGRTLSASSWPIGPR